MKKIVSAVCLFTTLFSCGRFANKNRTMIAVLHDINLASQYADKLFFLKEGHLAAQGSPNEIITREILFDVFQTETTIINNPISSTALVLYNPAAKGAS